MKLKSMILGLMAAAAAFALNSCTKKIYQDKLIVEPALVLAFKASDNKDIKINVTTTADSWEFAAPDWVVAVKEGSTLTVNVKENEETYSKVGRITFKAGDANPVSLNIVQDAFGTYIDPATAKAVSISGSVEVARMSITKGQSAEIEVHAFLAPEGESQPVAEKEIKVELLYDVEYYREYNYDNKSTTKAFPEDNITFPESRILTIPVGKSESEKIVLTLNAETLDFGTEYIVPLLFRPYKNAALSAENLRRTSIVMRKTEREVKNVVYFEMNDTNPLNALEYRLADGTPFFDAVILFAANINYNSTEDLVYLHNNPNVQALLDETDVYIQPLRKAGIKVYLGLLGNHDQAGLAQLSSWGAHEWAQEVAEACKKYRLDGVNLDDEYSSGADLSNRWFAPASEHAAGVLMCELKLALKEKCSWPTEVSHFDWGSIYTVPSVEIDGVTYKPSQFVDFHVADYGKRSPVYGDLTLANCSGESIQLNTKILPKGAGWADNLKHSGYGWCMWFAFDPSGTGSIANNYDTAFPLFKEAAKAFYNQDMQQPGGVYNKIGNGKYDPKRYDR